MRYATGVEAYRYLWDGMRTLILYASNGLFPVDWSVAMDDKRIRLPDSIEERLEFLGNQNDLTAMEIGYIVEHIFQYCTREEKSVDPETGEITRREFLIDPESEEEITAFAIYNTCAIAAKKSWRSIEDYRYVAKNVPDHVMLRYPQFGRTHWKAMIPHVNNEEELIALAEKMAEEADEYGGTMGVNAMRRRLKAGEELPAWERELNKLQKAAQRLVDDPDTPEWLVGMCKTVLTMSENPIYHYPPVFAEDTFLQVPTIEALKDVTEISVEMKPPLPYGQDGKIVKEDGEYKIVPPFP